jgi:hypothetical protein
MLQRITFLVLLLVTTLVGAAADELADLLDRLAAAGGPAELGPLIEELNALGDPRAAGPLARRYLVAEDSINELRDAVYGLGCAAALPAVVEGWRELDELGVNRLVDLAYRADDPTAHALLEEILAQGDERERVLAANLLGRLRCGPATEALAAALDDPSERVRLAVAGALGSLGRRAAELLELSEDAGSTSARRRYLLAALRCGDPTHAELFRRTLREAEGEELIELVDILALHRPAGWEEALLEALLADPATGAGQLSEIAAIDEKAAARLARDLIAATDAPRAVDGALRLLVRLEAPLEEDLLLPLLDDSSDRHYRSALALTGLLPPERAVGLLRLELPLDEPQRLAEWQLEPLTHVEGGAFDEVLIRAAAGGSETATRALHGRADGLEILLELAGAPPRSADRPDYQLIEACWALRGEPAAAETLRSIFADEDVHWEIGMAAAAALAYGGDAEALQLLRSTALLGENAFTSRALAYLEDIEPWGSIDVFAACLGGRSLMSGTGYTARRILRELEETPTGDIADACLKILRLSENPTAREDALWVLERRDDPTARRARRRYYDRDWEDD